MSLNCDIIMEEESAAVKITLSQGEAMRKHLLELQLLRTDLKIKKDDRFIYLPIIDKVSINNTISNQFDIIVTNFTKQHEKINDYKELLEFSSDLQTLLPASFDVIGSIILIKIDEQLIPFQKDIGNALLQTHSHVTSVYSIEPVEGELRTRSVSPIAGVEQTVTTHREFGVKYFVDIEKTYFSPRLATERKYISSIVEPNEVILDMFTGVAPFPIIISKFAKPKIIIGIDKNDEAIILAEKNVALNNFDRIIKLFSDDAKNASRILQSLNLHADRIIMNLPFYSFDFFTYALQCIKKRSIIHLYTIGDEESIEQRLDSLKKEAESLNFKIFIENKRKIKTYAPHEFYMGIDITAEKKEIMPT